MNTNIKLMTVFSKLSYVFIDTLNKNLESLGIQSSAYLMLAHLNEVGKAKTQKLGEVAVITSGSITHMVNRLEKQGYVIKAKDEMDKRIIWVSITQVGREAFEKVHTVHMEYLDDLLSEFSEEEKLALIEQIKYFGKTIDIKRRT